jgi:hypothetical protein
MPAAYFPNPDEPLATELAVVVGEVFAQEVLEMFLAKDDEMIQKLSANGAHPTLRMGVHFRTPRADTQYIQAFDIKCAIEIGAELVIEVADHMRGRRKDKL